jgi:hypothetical protein
VAVLDEFAWWVALGLAGISWVSVPIASVMAVLGVWLGRRQQRLAQSQLAITTGASIRR